MCSPLKPIKEWRTSSNIKREEVSGCFRCAQALVTSATWGDAAAYDAVQRRRLPAKWEHDDHDFEPAGHELPAAGSAAMLASNAPPKKPVKVSQ